MFTTAARTPILLLQIVAIYEISIENIFLSRLFRIYQVLFHIIFVYIPNILLIAYLTTVENFEVLDFLSNGQKSALWCSNILTRVPNNVFSPV